MPADHIAFAKYNTLNYRLAIADLPLPNLQSFKSLTTLTFSAKFSVRRFHRTLIDYFTNPLDWIIDLVDSLPSDQLRRLVLDFSFESSSYGFPHEVLHLLRRNWTSLGSVLHEKQPSTRLAVSLHGLDQIAIAIIEANLQSADFADCIVTK